MGNQNLSRRDFVALAGLSALAGNTAAVRGDSGAEDDDGRHADQDAVLGIVNRVDRSKRQIAVSSPGRAEPVIVQTNQFTEITHGRTGVGADVSDFRSGEHMVALGTWVTGTLDARTVASLFERTIFSVEAVDRERSVVESDRGEFEISRLEARASDSDDSVDKRSVRPGDTLDGCYWSDAIGGQRHLLMARRIRE